MTTPPERARMPPAEWHRKRIGDHGRAAQNYGAAARWAAGLRNAMIPGSIADLMLTELITAAHRQGREEVRKAKQHAAHLAALGVASDGERVAGDELDPAAQAAGDLYP